MVGVRLVEPVGGKVARRRLAGLEELGAAQRQWGLLARTRRQHGAGTAGREWRRGAAAAIAAAAAAAAPTPAAIAVPSFAQSTFARRLQ